jgi:hypothetical protein
LQAWRQCLRGAPGGVFAQCLVEEAGCVVQRVAGRLLAVLACVLPHADDDNPSDHSVCWLRRRLQHRDPYPTDR